MNKIFGLVFVILLIGIISAGNSSQQQVWGNLSDEGILSNQEVAAFYPLVADFGLGPNNEFSYSGDIQGTNIICEKIIGPDNLIVQSEPGKCLILWDRNNTADPTNNERGNHEVKIKVTNENNESISYSFIITVYSWIIPLNEGWNLISIPLVPENDNKKYNASIENVFLNQLNYYMNENQYTVYSYQFNSSTEFSSWLRSDSTGYGDLNEINPGYGYWVYVNQSTELKGFGRESAGTPPQIMPGIKVTTNSWVMIGRYGILGRDWSPGNSLDDRTHGPLNKGVALIV